MRAHLQNVDKLYLPLQQYVSAATMCKAQSRKAYSENICIEYLPTVLGTALEAPIVCPWATCSGHCSLDYTFLRNICIKSLPFETLGTMLEAAHRLWMGYMQWALQFCSYPPHSRGAGLHILLIRHRRHPWINVTCRVHILLIRGHPNPSLTLL